MNSNDLLARWSTLSLEEIEAQFVDSLPDNLADQPEFVAHRAIALHLLARQEQALELAREFQATGETTGPENEMIHKILASEPLNHNANSSGANARP